MRAPSRRRPRKRVIHVPPNTDLSDLANRVAYVGSPEHKDFPSFAGQPKRRADASICPRHIRDADRVTEWLRAAIRRGLIDGHWDGNFPRHVWYKDGDTVYEARLVNRGSGEYKGYPLNDDEWPRGIEEFYA